MVFGCQFVVGSFKCFHLIRRLSPHRNADVEFWTAMRSSQKSLYKLPHFFRSLFVEQYSEHRHEAHVLSSSMAEIQQQVA